MSFDPASMLNACRSSDEVFVRDHMNDFLIWLREVMEAGASRAAAAEARVAFLERRLEEAHKDQDFYYKEMSKLQEQLAEMKREKQSRPGRMIEV